MNFGQWINQQLENTGYTAYRLEIDANLGKGAVYRWTSGKHWPTYRHFMSVIDTLAKYTVTDPRDLIIDCYNKVRQS